MTAKMADYLPLTIVLTLVQTNTDIYRYMYTYSRALL